MLLMNSAWFFAAILVPNENGQMSGLRVDAVEDPLALLLDLFDALVVIEDPVQGLLRRRDVVAARAEADDRRLHLSDVEANPVAGDDLAGREFVADEEIVDHPLHLLAA